MIKKEGLFSSEEITRSDRSLHTPGSFARQNLLYVQEVGRLESLSPHRCIRENLDSFLFLIVLEGQGSLDVREKHYAIRQGDCALVDCMQHYEHISDEKNPWKIAWVHFNGHGARAYFELFLKYSDQKSVFSVQNLQLWDALIGKLLDGQNDKSLVAELHCGELLLQLMNLVIAQVASDTVEEGNGRQTANEIREYLNERYADRDVLSGVAQEFSQGISELNAVFGRYFGISPEEYVGSRRLNAAKELLRFTIKPLEQVAAEAGFEDLTTMQQVFRDQEGLSSEEYRAKWAQWIRENKV